MSRIRILDEITVGQIAAGEVVQRPVSVVKELVENSLDAGAGQVTVSITEGGQKEITVLDNGCGMSQEELSLAFCRHATSKITGAEDLYSISTLGFRGEALPSIAAVADLVLKSRPHSTPAGRKIHVKGGEILAEEPVGCPPGTSVHVKDLFYNTPARRKHLKSKGTESGLVAEIIQCMSLARPGVRFVLQNNNRVVFRSPGSGKLRDAASVIYGAAPAREMLEISTGGEDVYLEGLAAKPSFNRKTRSHMYLIVNGRYVRNKFIYQAIDEAYGTLIPSGRHPVAVICLHLDPSALDINIHPAKMEIKMDREQEIAGLLKETLRKNLSHPFLIPGPGKEAGSTAENRADTGIPAVERNLDSELSSRAAGENNSRNFEQQEMDFGYSREREPADFFQENPREGTPVTPSRVRNQAPGNIKLAGALESERQDHFPFLQVIGHLPPTYILTSGPEGLYIIDQHAAHERILYEEFSSSRDDPENNRVQMLLTPVPLDVDYKSAPVLQENLHHFLELGFVLEEFGEGSYLVRGIPAHLSTGKGVEQFKDLLEEISATEINKRGDFLDALITRLSCKAAIKSGETVSREGMNSLIQQLSRTRQPYTCPHGRPTLVNIPEKDLLHMFKRTN